MKHICDKVAPCPSTFPRFGVFLIFVDGFKSLQTEAQQRVQVFWVASESWQSIETWARKEDVERKTAHEAVIFNLCFPMFWVSKTHPKQMFLCSLELHVRQLITHLMKCFSVSARWKLLELFSRIFNKSVLSRSCLCQPPRKKHQKIDKGGMLHAP